MGGSATYLERFGSSGINVVPLDGDAVAVGSGEGNEVVITERTVSRLHAVFERFGAGWTIRDLGSTNGTRVNGARIAGSQVLHNGDEIRFGDARLVFRTQAPEEQSTTEAAAPAPLLTPRERDVLRALCRPLASGDVFTEPASIPRIAAELIVTEDAIKQHLRNLYDKFGLTDAADRKRRVRLANEAIRRGAFGLGDLKS